MKNQIINNKNKKVNVGIPKGIAYIIKNGRIRLLNIVYMPKTNKFMTSRNIKLPNSILKMFDNQKYDIDLIVFLEELGIYDIKRWVELLKIYDNPKDIFTKNYFDLFNGEEKDKEKKEIPKRKYIALKKYNLNGVGQDSE